MSRVKLLSVSVMAALSVFALSAASASARISFEWFVGGTLLKTGEKQTFEANTDGNTFDFHSVLSGAELLLLSSKIKVENGLLLGGKPGTSEETIVFEGVKSDKPKGCEVESLPNPVAGTVRTTVLKDEIVEGQNGEPLILFTPKTPGEPFTTLLLLKKGAEACTPANIPTKVTGSVLGLPLPQGTEVVRGNLVFPAVIDLYLLVNGESAPLLAGLKLGPEIAEFGGLTLVTLTSGDAYGVF